MLDRKQKIAQSRSWWINAAPRFTLYYVFGVIAATLLLMALPHVMGLIEGCAKYVEHDASIMPLVGLTAIGLMSVVFVFAPHFDGVLNPSLSRIFRPIICVVVPFGLLAYVLYLQVELYFPAILEYPDVLCD